MADPKGEPKATEKTAAGKQQVTFTGEKGRRAGFDELTGIEVGGRFYPTGEPVTLTAQQAEDLRQALALPGNERYQFEIIDAPAGAKE